MQLELMLLLLLKFALFLVIQLDVRPGLAQGCFQSAEDGLVPFDRNYDPGLPSGSQAIVTSYQFQCCGNVSEWQAVFRRSLRFGYTIHFQVWRPSPTVESDGCYSLVGENRFTSITPTERLVRETPEPTSIITVQPGDVLGYYSVYRQRNRRGGIALHEELRSETVWYHTSADSQIPVVGGSCPLPVGAGPNRTLNSSTTKGPVISASLVMFNCTSQSSATTTSHISASSAPPLPTNYLTMTPHMTTHPNAAGMRVRDNTSIIAGVCVSAVLVVTLGILAAAIAIRRRKRALSDGRRRDYHYNMDNSPVIDISEVTGSDHHYEMIPHHHEQIPLSRFHHRNMKKFTQNVSYISTPGIPVEANVCYSSTTVPAPADQDDLYESI